MTLPVLFVMISNHFPSTFGPPSSQQLSPDRTAECSRSGHSICCHLFIHNDHLIGSSRLIVIETAFFNNYSAPKSDSSLGSFDLGHSNYDATVTATSSTQLFSVAITVDRKRQRAEHGPSV